jgi:hypothetical protein
MGELCTDSRGEILYLEMLTVVYMTASEDMLGRTWQACGVPFP